MWTKNNDRPHRHGKQDQGSSNVLPILVKLTTIKKENHLVIKKIH